MRLRLDYVADQELIDALADELATTGLTNLDPFDLLLQLIGKHKLDVTEIALSKVTDEFIAHIKAGGKAWDLEQTTSFLLVASTLLDLKAARLLPQGDVEDEEDLALLEARDEHVVAEDTPPLLTLLPNTPLRNDARPRGEGEAPHRARLHRDAARARRVLFAVGLGIVTHGAGVIPTARRIVRSARRHREPRRRQP